MARLLLRIKRRSTGSENSSFADLLRVVGVSVEMVIWGMEKKKGEVEVANLFGWRSS